MHKLYPHAHRIVLYSVVLCIYRVELTAAQDQEVSVLTFNDHTTASCKADVTGPGDVGTPDGIVNVEDILYMLGYFGCRCRRFGC